MTQKDKDLLLKDICTRSPYGVICRFIWTYNNETTDGEDVIAEEDDNIRCIDFHTKEIQADYYGEWVDLEHCKPYLRPMSSMTEEEKELMKGSVICFNELEGNSTLFDEVGLDWLNKNHFDYRGLIPMGLALEAKEGMYKF